MKWDENTLKKTGEMAKRQSTVPRWKPKINKLL